MKDFDVGKLKFRDRVYVKGKLGTVISVHEPEWIDHKTKAFCKVLQGATARKVGCFYPQTKRGMRYNGSKMPNLN